MTTLASTKVQNTCIFTWLGASLLADRFSARTAAGSARQAPKLSDGVVLLDGFNLRDAGAHLAGEDDEHARRFGWYPEHSTIETVRRAIRRWQENWRRGAFRRAWAVREVATAKLVGGCELRLRPSHTAHVSYWTFPTHRRHGFASRATRLACEFALENWPVDRIEAHIELDNLGSRGVAWWAGFVEQGMLQQPGAPAMVVYVRVRDERGWQSQQGPAPTD